MSGCRRPATPSLAHPQAADAKTPKHCGETPETHPRKVLPDGPVRSRRAKDWCRRQSARYGRWYDAERETAGWPYALFRLRARRLSKFATPLKSPLRIMGKGSMEKRATAWSCPPPARLLGGRCENRKRQSPVPAWPVPVL